MGIGEMGIRAAQGGCFFIHLGDEIGLGRRNRFGYGNGRITAGYGHHAGQGMAQGNLVARIDAQNRRIAFDVVNVIGDVEGLVHFALGLAQFDAEDTGHDFRRAARIGPVVGIFRIERVTRIGIHDIGGMSADFRRLWRIGKDGGRHGQAGGCSQTEDSFQRHSIHFFLYKGFFAAILGLRGYFLGLSFTFSI